MPLNDTSRVLSSPRFRTTFDVVRTTTTVGDDGETIVASQTFSGIGGVVTPANSNDLKRMAEVERLSGAIAIHTTFRLVAGGLQADGTTATADIIVWGPKRIDSSSVTRRYSVFGLDDWTEFGAGFVRATATMLDLT